MTVELALFFLGTVGLGLEAFRVSLRWLSFGWAGLCLIAIAAYILPAI